MVPDARVNAGSAESAAAHLQATSDQTPQSPRFTPSALEIHWHQDAMELIRNLPSSLTEEQSVIGLFCCHSIVSFDQLLENHPSAKDIQTAFRDFISSLWTQWLNDSIKKDVFIAAMFTWVRSASTLTKDLDIIEEFVSWFESLYGIVDHHSPSKPQP